jgi:Bacterial extracellular solute-binding proteins, family 5 Middle
VYVQEQDEPLLLPTAATARAAGKRYRLTRSNWTEGLALNTRRPLFSDPRLRLAVAYAIDRRALAAAAGGPDGIPTSGVVSPSQPGYADTAGFPLRRDLARARRLAGGRHARAVLAALADDRAVYEQPVIALLRRQLAAIGIGLSLLPIRQTIAADHPQQFHALLARADLAIESANNEQASDPVGYLRQLGERYLPSADRATRERIDKLSSPERESAADALALKLEQEAVYVQYLNRAIPELVSKRLGCVFDQPEYPGLDLTALCLGRG